MTGDDVPTLQRIELADLDYDLPASLIAQHPPRRREEARLLIVDRGTGTLRDGQIRQLPELFRRGDLLVLNDVKVLPAKFTVRRATGGKVPGLFVEDRGEGVWRVLLQGSRRLRAGEFLSVSASDGEPIRVELLDACGEGHWDVRVTAAGTTEQILEKIGKAPLPPYIQRKVDDDDVDREDRERYQTVFADKPGAIAAPTAGLHLTAALLDRLRGSGVGTAFVTLYVGLGTFKPISAPTLAAHAMHEERFDLPESTAEEIRACGDRGGRVIAVGTTSVRVLESAAESAPQAGRVRAGAGATRLFIYPPYPFRVVDALLTNFHLPRSTLLALVMAFAGRETVRHAYAHAVAARYRFYSYGDAMLIA